MQIPHNCVRYKLVGLDFGGRRAHKPRHETFSRDPSVLAALPAGAGQNDADLDSLYDILKMSGASAEIRAAESLIWRA